MIPNIQYMNVHVSRHLKEEQVLVIDKWLWVISNKMLFLSQCMGRSKDLTGV